MTRQQIETALAAMVAGCEIIAWYRNGPDPDGGHVLSMHNGPRVITASLTGTALFLTPR